MGKYDKVVSKLKALPVEDLNYQSKVDVVKQQITGGTTQSAESLAKLYILARVGEDSEPDIQDIEQSIYDNDGSGDDPGHVAEALIRLLGKEGLEDLLSKVQLRLTAIEQLLAASKDDDDPGWGEYGASDNTLKLRSGQSIEVHREPLGKVTDREKFREWCIKNGHEHELALPYQTMNAITKDRLMNGNPEPDGVEAFFRHKIVFKRG